ncbi:MAG TPA: hypothetical protein GXX26_10325 [Clostridiaceae bacterium]|nr:hypothetical protein [Clostridiaceae bacterium]
MQYNDILRKIEQDALNDNRTDLYRYNGLLEAIRFFSNRLTLDQITDAAFDFVNELLTVHKSAMYLLKNNGYELVKQRGYKSTHTRIEITRELDQFALYVGNVINGRNALTQYFETDLLDELEASVMLPLLLEDKLYGFFLLSGRITASFNDNDIFVCTTLMNLFNNSLENSNRLERLRIINHELDEKIFNLFAINQSARAMLTEHRLEQLYGLAVDVFSELTQSAHTGFILYDEPSEKYALKAYRNVFDTSGKMETFSLDMDPDVHNEKQILDLSDENDLDCFCRMFAGGKELLDYLNASYVVFIFGDFQKILGFVTLGRTVTGNEYKKSAFELVNSLASYTFIALSNALLIETVNRQKMQLQEKLDRLIKLNRLSKNINSALDSSTLIELTLETLVVSFGVQSAMITLYDEENNCLNINNATDLSLVDSVIPMNPSLEQLKKGRIIFESDSDMVSSIIGYELANALSDNSGILIIPMTLDRYETVLIGAIIIFKLKDGLLSNEENTLTFETVANQIAPLINGFTSLEKQQNLLRQDASKVFLMNLQEQIRECRTYDFDMEIIRIIDMDATPYRESNVPAILSNIVKDVFPVSYAQTEVFVMQDFEYNYSIVSNALAGMNVNIRRLRYNRDFVDMESFLAIK